MKLTVIANNVRAHLVDGEAVKAWSIVLADDGTASAGLGFVTGDPEVAARFRYGATLEIDLGTVVAPEAPAAPDAPDTARWESLRAWAAGEPAPDAPAAASPGAGEASAPSPDVTPTRRPRR